MSSETSRFDVVGIDIPLDERGLRLVPIGDIHANAPMFASDAFFDWCKKERIISKKIPTYYIGVGDYLETLSYSERKAITQGLHESTAEWLDVQVIKDVDKLANRLKWTKGKWLGMLCGNHTYITQDGETLTQLLANRLDARALGICAAIRLHICIGTTQLNYDIWAYHGKSSGITAGATLNALERWASGIDADLILMGHDHRRAAAPLSVLSVFGGSKALGIREHEKWLVRTGSFLKGYEPGKVSYVAGKALKPISLGTATIMLSKSQKRHGKIRDIQIKTEVKI